MRAWPRAAAAAVVLATVVAVAATTAVPLLVRERRRLLATDNTRYVCHESKCTPNSDRGLSLQLCERGCGSAYAQPTPTPTPTPTQGPPALPPVYPTLPPPLGVPPPYKTPLIKVEGNYFRKFRAEGKEYPFSEAVRIMRTLGLKSADEYKKLQSEGRLPGFHSKPSSRYKKHWRGWGYFLGTAGEPPLPVTNVSKLEGSKIAIIMSDTRPLVTEKVGLGDSWKAVANMNQAYARW